MLPFQSSHFSYSEFLKSLFNCSQIQRNLHILANVERNFNCADSYVQSIVDASDGASIPKKPKKPLSVPKIDIPVPIQNNAFTPEKNENGKRAWTAMWLIQIPERAQNV